MGPCHMDLHTGERMARITGHCPERTLHRWPTIPRQPIMRRCTTTDRRLHTDRHTDLLTDLLTDPRTDLLTHPRTDPLTRTDLLTERGRLMAIAPTEAWERMPSHPTPSTPRKPSPIHPARWRNGSPEHRLLPLAFPRLCAGCSPLCLL